MPTPLSGCPRSVDQRLEDGVEGGFGLVLHLRVGGVLDRMRDEDALDLGEAEGAAVEPVSPSEARAVQFNMDLERALARLPDVSRVVVMLYHVEGYSHAEIAQLMGMSVSFSKSQLSRAHARLRDWLGPDAPGRDADELAG